MNAGVVSAFKTQKRRSQDSWGNERDKAPQKISCCCSKAKEMAQKQREASLGTTGTARKGHSRRKQLHKGARRHNREEIHLVLAKGEHQEIRHQIEEGKLQHGDDNGEHHRREMPGRKLELVGERVNLAIDKAAPSLNLRLGHANALEQVDDPMRQTRHHARHERHGKDTKQDEAVAAKTEDAQQRDVAVVLGKIRHPGQKQNGAPGNETKLVHDESRELRGAGLSHVLSCLGQTVNLSRRGAHHHGREIAKKDARGLDGNKIANTHRRIGIEPHGNRVSKDTEDEVQEHEEAGNEEPAALHRRHGAPKLRHLSRDHQIDDIGDEDNADEDGATTRGFGVVAAGNLNVNLRMRSFVLKGPRHGSPLIGRRTCSIVRPASHYPQTSMQARITFLKGYGRGAIH